MGVQAKITAEKFPKQGSLMREVEADGSFKIIMLTTSMRAELMDAPAGKAN